MRLRILSDLHLAINLHYGFLKPFNAGRTLKEQADVCIIAGDLCELRNAQNTIKPFLSSLCKHHDLVIYVPGNHEYYTHSNDPRRYKPQDCHFHKKNLLFHKRVMFCNNESFDFEGVHFVCSTLWSDIKNHGVVNAIADFHAIEDMTFDAYRNQYLESKAFLEQAIQKDSVVISHHAPSHLSIAEIYKTSTINECFYSDLDHLMFYYEPKLWVHGHTHTSFNYQRGPTQVVCNPFGYGNENPEFNWDFIVEV